jgi:hypothetical protein
MLAAVFGSGLFLVVTTSGATAGQDDRAVLSKRQDGVSELVAVDDDDELNRDQTRSRSGRTGNSRSGRDHTNSRVTAVSRDRDLSRRDLTKDWTRDGGDRTRDHSRNHTNDRSRNDTRR